jgi:cobalt-zinc-cadmium efflux system outer membrane protein
MPARSFYSPESLRSVALCALFAATAAGAVGGETGFTTEQLVAQAERDNKDLQAARYAIDVARARLQQAGLREPPTLEVASSSDLLFGNDGEYSRSIGVTQAFPLAHRLAREKDVARVDIALAEVEVAEAERKLAGEVAELGYRLLVLDRRIASRAELVQAEEGLARTTRARFKAAEVSELDVNAVQLELQRLAQERARLQAERDALRTNLNTRLGRAAEAPLVMNAKLPAPISSQPLAQWQARALAQRPDLRGALLAVDRSEAERALAKASRWQDWTLGLALSQDHLVIDGAPPQDPSRALGVSVSIPLPLTKRSTGALAEADANQAQARARVDALQANIAGEVAAAHAQATRLESALAAFDAGAQRLGERNLKLSREGYSQGLVPLAEVIQAQRLRTELNADYLDTLEQYLSALARFHTAVGDYATRTETFQP